MKIVGQYYWDPQTGENSQQLATGSLIYIEADSIHTWQYGFSSDTVSIVFTSGTKEFFAYKKRDGFVSVEEANAIIWECSNKDLVNLDDYGWVIFGYEFLSESLED